MSCGVARLHVRTVVEGAVAVAEYVQVCGRCGESVERAAEFRLSRVPVGTTGGGCPSCAEGWPSDVERVAALEDAVAALARAALEEDAGVGGSVRLVTPYGIATVASNGEADPLHVARCVVWWAADNWEQVKTVVDGGLS